MPTSADLVESCLEAIATHNERTNAFILVDADHAREAARVADDEKRRGIDRGPMHGMPISLKDLIDVAGQPTTAGSRVRDGHIAKQDATVVTRLREAGAVLIGKTNLHEFALGPTSDESAFGPVRNPYDETRVSGGSSGGAAVAVATGMSIAAIGSDTGGSIRIPAAACGVVGLKASLGEIPTDGVVPLSTTLDHVGPLTKSVGDAATLWAILAGRPVRALPRRELSSVRLGALGPYFTTLLADEVRAAYDGAIARLREQRATIEPKTIAHTDAIVTTYGDISLPEAAHWHAATIATRAADYQPIVRDRLQRGAAIPAVSYIEAMRMRALYRELVDVALDGCDALVLPTLPIVAPRIGDSEVSFGGHGALPVRAALLRLTQLFNLTGHPAITLPIQAPGLPVGIQLVGHRDRTEDLLSVASEIERAMV